MILGLSIATFTIVHVAISLVAIGAGLIWLLAQVRGTWLARTNMIFLVTTIATSVTGFFFPAATITPAAIFGILSLAILAVAVVALGVFKRHGIWSRVYTGTAAFALYLNCFVLVVQSFQKVGALHALAPTGSEPPFAVAQAVLLIALLAIGWLGIKHSASPAEPTA